MKKYIYLTITLLSLLSVDLFAQSLSVERVSKIKRSTVKISLNNQILGTGFFIDDKGTVLTCWHVVKSSIFTRSDKTTGIKSLLIEYSNGKKDSVCIPTRFYNKMNDNSLAYDFCILIPNRPLEKKDATTFLKLGSLTNALEGEEVFTCGYPLGISQQFVSRGIISTKYVDSTNYIFNLKTNVKTFKPRSQALLDLTLNRGNSGGAIIKIGKTIEDDEVIGIADFIVSQMGNEGDQLIQNLASRSGRAYINGVDPNAILTQLAIYISKASNGVSGCIAIDHFKKIMDGW
jgi:serine protease Do